MRYEVGPIGFIARLPFDLFTNGAIEPACAHHQDCVIRLTDTRG